MFHKVRHAIALEQFKEERKHLLLNSNPDERRLAELKTLAETVRTYAAELDAVAEKYAQYLPRYVSDAQRQFEAERAQQLADFRDRVKSIEL